MNTDRAHNGALVGGTLLIGFGLLALAGQIFRNVLDWSFLWPLAIVVVGALFFAGMFLGGRSVSGLAIPGTIVGGMGLVLLYQNLTSHWESWAYSWALIVLLVGLGIFLAGAYGRNEGQRQAGFKVMKIGFILFIIFGAFFEMVFSMDRSLGLRGVLFPSLLILFGLYLIVRRLGLLPWDRTDNTSATIPPQPPSAS
jgi:hypothetical protein